MQVQNVVNKTVINATGATIVNSGPCVFHGYMVLGAAGAFTMDVYDSAAAASGQKVVDTLSVAAATEKLMPQGLQMDNGIVANMSGDPTDGLVLVLWSK
jgi:hypothetical protein